MTSEEAVSKLLSVYKAATHIMRDMARDLENEKLTKEQVVGTLDTMADQFDNLLDALVSDLMKGA